MKIKLLWTAFISLLLLWTSVYADEANAVNEFQTGSYQKILAKHAGNPLILVIWSLSCSSCIKDMELLDEVHKKHPQLAMVMLSADEPADAEDIKNLLAKFHLGDAESWVFAADDAQKLRYEIDPAWYGELPRTYFFDKAHNRTGASGALTMQDFTQQIAKIAR